MMLHVLTFGCIPCAKITILQEKEKKRWRKNRRKSECDTEGSCLNQGNFSFCFQYNERQLKLRIRRECLYSGKSIVWLAGYVNNGIFSINLKENGQSSKDENRTSINLTQALNHAVSGHKTRRYICNIKRRICRHLLERKAERSRYGISRTASEGSWVQDLKVAGTQSE